MVATSVRAGESSLPTELSGLAAEIEASRALLDLHDDWDGDGSPGYDHGTWLRATRFLGHNAELVWRNSGGVVPVPDIGPGPSGSFDLHWRTNDRELLVNVPADPARPVRFYGDDGAKGTPIEGELTLADTNSWLLLWLIRR